MYFPFFLSPPQIMHYLGILEYFIWLNLEILKRPKWHNQCPTGKLRNKKKKIAIGDKDVKLGTARNLIRTGKDRSVGNCIP